MTSSMLLLGCGRETSAAGGGGLISPAFFVSPTGNDGNSGTEASPFLTLGAAQTAMAGGATKTTYIRGGTYSLGTGLILVSADSNTTWIAYPAETPTIDGGGTTGTAFKADSGAANITWNGLTIQNFVDTGIDIMGAGMVVTNNTIRNLTSDSTNKGCIYAHFILGTTNISNNTFRDNTGPGVCIGFGAGDPGISGSITINHNLVLNVNTALADSGGIYVMDRSHTNTALSITNNAICNYGQSPYTSTQGIGIYLDDNMSHCTVTGNLVTGNGMYAIQYHGGDHNVVTNNVFDITGAVKLALYQDDPSFVIGGGGMAGNTLTNNIIYSSATAPSALWDYIDTSVTIALPNVTNNLYYNTTGTFSNKGSATGGITESNPTTGDPLFVDVTGRDYTVSGSSPALPAPVNWSQLAVPAVP